MSIASKSWFFPALGASLLAGVVACTVTTGPDVDTDPPISSSSSGDYYSSSSSGDVDDAGSCDLPTDQFDDGTGNTEACVTCTYDTYCTSSTQGIFCPTTPLSTDANDNATNLLAAYDSCQQVYGDDDGGTDLNNCFDAANTQYPAASNAYQAFLTCQADNCATQCGVE